MPTQIPQKRFEKPLVKPAPNNINPERKKQIKKENQQYRKVITGSQVKLEKHYGDTLGFRHLTCRTNVSKLFDIGSRSDNICKLLGQTKPPCSFLCSCRLKNFMAT